MTSDLRCVPGRLGVLLAAAAWLSGCASSRAPAEPREYLDEATAATITVWPRSLVLGYDRTDLGAHARDYVTLTGVDVNTAGRHASHLVGYAWSTLDKRAVEEGDATCELVAEDRRLPLTLLPDGFRSLGMGTPPIAPPARSAVPLAATVSRESLTFFLEAADPRLVCTRSGAVERFTLWERDRTR